MVLAHAGTGPNGLRIAYILNLNGNKNKSQPQLSHGTGSLQTMEIHALLSVPSAWEKKGNSKLPRLNSLPALLVLSPCPAPEVSLGREAPAVVLIGPELSGCQGESEQLRL